MNFFSNKQDPSKQRKIGSGPPAMPLRSWPSVAPHGGETRRLGPTYAASYAALTGVSLPINHSAEEEKNCAGRFVAGQFSSSSRGPLVPAFAASDRAV